MEAKKKEDIWQYKEYLPENSQVIVDYTKPPKDQVAFNYPVKRSYIRSVLHSGYYTFMLEWYVFNGKYIVLPLIALLLIYATAKGQTYNFLQHLDNNIKHLFLPNKEIINSNVITVTHLNYYCIQ